MKRNLNGRQPAKNIVPNPPVRKFRNADGVMVTEKLSPLWGMKMVSPAGDVVQVVLSTGYTIRSLKNNDHGQQKLTEKLAAGFIPFAECPITKGYLQLGNETGCKGSDGRGQFTDQECCPHVTKVILASKDAYRTAAMDNDKAFQTRPDRMMAFLEKQAEQNISAPPPAAGKKPGALGG